MRVQRNTGEIVTTRVNYLTGVRSVAIGSVSDECINRSRRTRLPKRALLTIEQVGDGMAFEAG